VRRCTPLRLDRLSPFPLPKGFPQLYSRKWRRGRPGWELA
jgi:hypothetical protein